MTMTKTPPTSPLFLAYFSQKELFSAGMVIGFGHLIGKVVAPITSIPTVIANFYAAKDFLRVLPEFPAIYSHAPL